MKTKVYLVSNGSAHEWEEPIGVYSTHDKALDKVNELIKEKNKQYEEIEPDYFVHNKFNFIYIKEFELQ